MPLFIEELGLSYSTTAAVTVSKNTTSDIGISALGELLKQPELLSQPIHSLDWSIYHNNPSKRARL